MRNLILGSAAVAALAAAVPASAGTVVFTNGGTVNGSSRTYTDGVISVSVTGVSFKNGTLAAVSRPGAFSEGLGVQPSGDGQHTVDNNGNVDFLMMTFSSSVALTGATFANNQWYGYKDSDASISWANYDFAAHGMTFGSAFGSSSNQSAFLNGTLPSLSSNLFSSDTTAKGTNSRDFNALLNSGNTWLIGASLNNLDKKVDSFKLSNLQYQMVGPTTGGVPEPATWAMLILGMGVVGGAMRRRSATVGTARAAIRFS